MQVKTIDASIAQYDGEAKAIGLFAVMTLSKKQRE